MRAPIVPDELPDEARATTPSSARCASNDIVKGKFLSPDGELALAVIALDRKAVEEKGAKVIIGGIAEQLKNELAPVGLKSHLTGAPVMQLEIRNAVERDQIVYNGLGLLFGATIAVIFFKRVSLMLLAALPPVLAVLWSLGLLGLDRLQAQPVPQRHDAAGHGDGLCRQHADGVGHPHPPARGRHARRRPCASPCASSARPACWRTARRCCRSWRCCSRNRA